MKFVFQSIVKDPTKISNSSIGDGSRNVTNHEPHSRKAKRSESWAKEKAQKIIGAAQDNPDSNITYNCHSITLRMLISRLLELHEHLSHLEREIVVFSQERKEYDLLCSIPGIGDNIAATILSEIGEIERFDHPKKLVAFSGIDPSV